MAVTKATYTATATWTAAQLATIFETAFVDAGLMTAWHDSFLSGSVENRILAVDYGTGTYAVTYYWFQFTTTGAFVAQATGWNAGTHVPTGTQYLDYFATTTNATTNHVQFLALTTSTTVTLTRYTSGNHTFFVLRSGTSYYTFGIDHAGVTLQGWMDLSKGYHNGLVRAVNVVDWFVPGEGNVKFNTCYRLRRAFLDGSTMRGETSGSNYAREAFANSYFFMSNRSSNPSYANTSTGVGLMLPLGANNANSEFSTDFNPVYTGIRHLSTVADNLPADFGVAASRSNNTNAIQDALVVSAGVEEWEILAFANGGGVIGQASPLFLARIV
jgi:hypothetical protein